MRHLWQETRFLRPFAKAFSRCGRNRVSSLIDISQPFHYNTAQIYQKASSQKRKIITTNYIISELVALLSSPLHIPISQAIAFIEGLKNSPYVTVSSMLSYF